jgi:hydroxypyruvate reductase
MQEDDLAIVLISGGSSALFTYPVDGISLADLKITNQILLSCGADIREINTIRKHLSRVKGGQLAKFLQPAQVLTCILSDVIGDPIDMIGSGPTAPDPTTYADGLAVIERYQLEGELPPPVIKWLDQGLAGKYPETPKPGDQCFKKVSNLILASNRDALLAGVAQAEKEGFSADILPHVLIGEASSAGRNLAKRMVDLALKGEPFPRPACLIAGGETTVTLTNTQTPGLGGRNLELALSALPLLDGLEDITLITLATDGEDGLTDAAGAVVTGESSRICQQLGQDPQAYLELHDSYTLFKKLDDLLITEPTGTNVNDLCFLFTL